MVLLQAGLGGLGGTTAGIEHAMVLSNDNLNGPETPPMQNWSRS